MTTPVWLNDPRILLRKDKIMEIWPSQDMTAEEKVNAVSRLVIILVIIGFLLTLKVNIFVLGAATLGIVYLLYFLLRCHLSLYKCRLLAKKRSPSANSHVTAASTSTVPVFAS